MTNGQERRPRRRPGENRERLVRAGISEFGAYGYHGASTTAIAAAAEVPQPHVYASFETKRELFLACVDRATSELRTGQVTPEHRTDPFAGELTAYKLLVFQAISTVGDAELEGALRPHLVSLRAALGVRAFDEILRAAAATLLMPPQE